MLNFSKLKLLLVLIPCIWAIYSSVPHLNYSRVETSNDAQQAIDSGVELTASIAMICRNGQIGYHLRL